MRTWAASRYGKRRDAYYIAIFEFKELGHALVFAYAIVISNNALAIGGRLVDVSDVDGVMMSE